MSHFTDYKNYDHTSSVPEKSICLVLGTGLCTSTNSNLTLDFCLGLNSGLTTDSPLVVPNS